MKTEEGFNVFLDQLIKELKEKEIALKHATWKLAIDGKEESAQELARLDQDIKLFFKNEPRYHTLIDWQQEGTITSPDLLRILNLLIEEHKMSQVPDELLKAISDNEAKVIHTYTNFRTSFENKEVSENDLVDILEKEANIERRKRAWDASKKVGEEIAPLLVSLVKKRNQLAHRLGYSDFYQMKLDQDEIDKDWLFEFLEDFEEATKDSYNNLIKDIDINLAKKFDISKTAIGPWAWKDPFCQEDPLATSNLNDFVASIDIVEAGKKFFQSIGFNVDSILKRSDLFEKEGKNQHAFCLNLDQEHDIRILTNIRPNMRWLETLIHELGHAVYEQGYDPKLHWYLRRPPHMLTTEAVALITGRQAYDPIFLKDLIQDPAIEEKLKEAKEIQKRRQLIFSRWVLVMVYFESALYANPEQDLNFLWWTLVQKHQKIFSSSHRGGKHDWACKCHLGIAPVYYHSYLLGEFFASMIKEHFFDLNQTDSMYKHTNTAQFLKEKLFFPGNRMRWDYLIQSMMKEPLHFKAWVQEFC